MICTLGNFSTKLLRGDPTGISRLHGQPEVHVLGHRAVRLYPIYHPAAALYTPSMLETLRDRLRAPAGAARGGTAASSREVVEEVPEFERAELDAPPAAEADAAPAPVAEEPAPSPDQLDLFG